LDASTGALELDWLPPHPDTRRATNAAAVAKLFRFMGVEDDPPTQRRRVVSSSTVSLPPGR
jgi:hypothetical protein